MFCFLIFFWNFYIILLYTDCNIFIWWNSVFDFWKKGILLLFIIPFYKMYTPTFIYTNQSNARWIFSNCNKTWIYKFYEIVVLFCFYNFYFQFKFWKISYLKKSLSSNFIFFGYKIVCFWNFFRLSLGFIFQKIWKSFDTKLLKDFIKFFLELFFRISFGITSLRFCSESLRIQNIREFSKCFFWNFLRFFSRVLRVLSFELWI